MYKPFGVLSQFSKDKSSDKTLSDCVSLSKNIYPVGRLDKDSEGLLLLTNDNKLKHKLTDPKFNHGRTYYVQVEGLLTIEKINLLSSGVVLKDGLTKKASVSNLDNPPILQPRIPAIRFRKNIPTSWVKIELKEGKNRQIRRMTASVGLPTLRIVRVAIGNIWIENMKPGEIRYLTKKDFT